jgi:DNA polymerase I-like protein with 3'-5' exonuclease and polymerase domains
MSKIIPVDLKAWAKKWLEDFWKEVSNLFIGDYISIDLETTGLDMVGDQIHFFTYDYNGEIGLVLMRPDLTNNKIKIPKHVEKALRNRKVKKIIQSSQFDIPFFRMKTDIHLRNIWDTQVMEQVILAGRGNPWHDADLAVALKRRGIANLEKDTRESFIDYWGPITQKQKSYGIKDIKYLRGYAEQQLADLKKAKLEAVAVLENRTCEVTAELRYNGVAFDEQFWIDLAEENMKEYEKRLSALPKEVDNWNSEKQVKEYFWEEHGIKIDSLSDLPEVKNKVLDKYKYAREKVGDVNNYGLNFLFRDKKKRLKRLVDPDGRVRPSYNQIVDTGRYSCSKPNLQNQKAKTPHRLAFIAPDGTDLVVGDFTGQELGAIAAGSRDPVWLEALSKKHDLHSVMADKMYHNWREMGNKNCKFPFKCDCPKHLELRRPAKDLNFGLSYGKQAAAFARDMGISLSEAYKIIRSWKRPIRKVVKWLEDNGAFAIKHGWIRTLAPFNRIRYFRKDEPDWRKRNMGMNTPIQGSGADMMKLAMCMIYEYSYDIDINDIVKLVLTVHDELLTECKKKFSKEWARVMKFLMEESAMVITKDHLITTEPEIVERWKPKS